MTQAWMQLDPHDRDIFQNVVAFLQNRLAKQETVDWALGLKPTQRAERSAITYLLNSPKGEKLQAPWSEVWRLVEEAWSSERQDEPTAIYGIQRRLKSGDRSGAVLSAIVELVAPRLHVEVIASWQRTFMKKRRNPKTADQILSASLTSGSLLDLEVLDLSQINEIQFLKSLAYLLEASLSRGLDIARRIGWKESRSLLRLGMVNRVYYTQGRRVAAGDNEADAYSRGVAPAVKLLHAVVRRLGDLDNKAAGAFLQRWRLEETPLHARLWAAIARDATLISGASVGEFLLALDDRKFWDVHNFPEIAELRALRFNDLSDEAKKLVSARLQDLPPTSMWPKKISAKELEAARTYWAAREFMRIEGVGGQLPDDITSRLAPTLDRFDDLRHVELDDGFPESPRARWVAPNPDNKYDALEGVPRLRALEVALTTARRGWDDDPAERANDWLQNPEHVALVLNDFATTEDGGSAFPSLWSRVAWTHSPRPAESAEGRARNLQDEAKLVLGLLAKLTDDTLSKAIDGISAWLDSWAHPASTSPLGLGVWLRLWPIAVAATNAAPENPDQDDVSSSGRIVSEDAEPMDLDTLNTPAGKLIGVFLARCSGVLPNGEAFSPGSPERTMRDVVIAAEGRSGLIVRHRLIEHLPYFLDADKDWAQKHLVAPLLADDGPSLALWRAIARRTRFTEVLRVIGSAMVERATDKRIGRESRASFVFSLVVETLHAFREGHDPAVSKARVLQMLRTVEDELRLTAAEAVQQFISDLSKDISPEVLFRSSAKPFLRDVWPQERSLVTPGISAAFADLPATSGEAFAEAVETIERFLMYFDCWTMFDFGFDPEQGDQGLGLKSLDLIDDEAKARALLRLLDLTISNSDVAVVPYDLTAALDRIRSVVPQLTESGPYRRLATAARR